MRAGGRLKFPLSMDMHRAHVIWASPRDRRLSHLCQVSSTLCRNTGNGTAVTNDSVIGIVSLQLLAELSVLFVNGLVPVLPTPDRYINKPQTEEARRSIRPAYHELSVKLQHCLQQSATKATWPPMVHFARIRRPWRERISLS